MVLSAEEIVIHWTLTPKKLLCYSLDSAAYMHVNFFFLTLSIGQG